MTDLVSVLPRFPVGQYAKLMPALENQQITTTDLLTLDLADIGKRTQLPLLEIKKLCNAVLDALHTDLGVGKGQKDAPEAGKGRQGEGGGLGRGKLRHSFQELGSSWSTISTLDATVDGALGGGIPTGYVTEITGESGAGKTQFLLSLLLAVQLPAPHGLSRPALYITTEAALSTRRLSQMLSANPLFRDLPAGARPSLDNIISTATPDLESQDHILFYQVPVEVARRDIGLVVLDSVAANYRAEFDRRGSGGAKGPAMAARSADLVRLGTHLRELARAHNLAVVVANQVADRFEPPSTAAHARFASSQQQQQQQQHLGRMQESPLARRSRAGPPPPSALQEPSSSMAHLLPPRSSMPEPPPPLPSLPPGGYGDNATPAHPALLLDHQQRWFTGWGDDPREMAQLKTPSLGLVWSTQIAARIVLFKRPAYGRNVRVAVAEHDDEGGSGGAGSGIGPGTGTPGASKTWRRWMKVVFAPHVPASGDGLDGAVEFDITMGGVLAVKKQRVEARRGEEGL